MRRWVWVTWIAFGVACSQGIPRELDADKDAFIPDTVSVLLDAKSPADTMLDSDGTEVAPDEVIPEATSPDCPDGVVCVDSLPFHHSGNTSVSPLQFFDAYGCAPDTNESGPEVVYRVEIAHAGFLSAAVSDGEGVDVDVHILSALDPDACLARGHHHAAVDVSPGVVYVVVDTFVKGADIFSGTYELHLGLTLPSQGPCSLETGVMQRVGDDGEHLQMPATGPVVLEAHLVTQEEPKPYPATSTEELQAHYMLSQERSGFVMHRTQHWAPLEGGAFYGAGISSPTLFPVLDEHWYVCMYWIKESRPARGTRMIFRVPGTQRAVVVAAGYETGPGNLANIGGTTEETHFYLGTGHKSELTLGIATDQTLPLGPRVCQ